MAEAASCSFCSVRPGSKVCSRCHKATYCSYDCQKAAWRKHKKTCGVTTQSESAVCPGIKNLVDQGDPVPEEVASFANGRDFLACCDRSGASLEFGVWWHKRGSGRGGVPSFDICEVEYNKLPKREHDGFVRINSMRDVVTHMGLPGEVDEIDLASPGESSVGAGADANNVELARGEVLRLLDSEDRQCLTAAEVIDSSLLSVPPEAVRAAMTRVAKDSAAASGWYYTRGDGEEDLHGCALKRDFLS